MHVQKKEKYRTNTKVQHAYNKDYHLCNIENMQGKIQSVCIWVCEYEHVYVCVCMCVRRVHACVRVWVRLCACVCMRVGVSVCGCVCVRACD